MQLHELRNLISDTIPDSWVRYPDFQADTRNFVFKGDVRLQLRVTKPNRKTEPDEDDEAAAIRSPWLEDAFGPDEVGYPRRVEIWFSGQMIWAESFLLVDGRRGLVPAPVVLDGNLVVSPLKLRIAEIVCDENPRDFEALMLQASIEDHTAVPDFGEEGWRP